jgi:DNA repair protein RadC
MDGGNLTGTNPLSKGKNPIQESTHKGHRAHLRERFRKTGLAGFADHEVLELLLTLCIPRHDVKPQAKLLLKHFGSIRNVFDAPLEEMVTFSGIGETTATGIKILKELATLYLKECVKKGPLLNNNQELLNFWIARLGGLKHEVFEAAYLDKNYRLLPEGIERIEEGTVDRAAVYPRKVITAALKRSAVNIVLAHNHPSGDHRPSPFDFQITQTLKYVCDILGIRILDHIIVTDQYTYSFRQSGFLD